MRPLDIQDGIVRLEGNHALFCDALSEALPVRAECSAARVAGRRLAP
jgi:hypothetical protein